MSPEDKVQAAINEELDHDEMEAFQKEALEDSALLARYTESAWLNGQLRALGAELPSLFSSIPANVSRLRPKAFRFLPLISSVAAAMLGVFVTLLISREAPHVATIVEAEGCQWAGSELPTSKGSRLRAGTLNLMAGMATLEFESGARIVLEAPAVLEVSSRMRCRLLEGSLVADVPESAHGFTIDAPQLEVVDLGTRFGLTTNQFGKSHVMVFEGEVEVTKTQKNETISLKTGSTLVNGADIIAPNQEIHRNEEPATREGWEQITAMKDSFVRFGAEHGNYGSSPLIMVKETDLSPNNRRRGIVSFDLSAVADREIQAAEIYLDIESSGLGFSTLIPDSVFAIYGVTDDELDAWEETGVVWVTLPGVSENGPIPGVTRKLGTFEISRGASAVASVKVQTPDLADYLRKDANRIATFLIVRETGEYETQGLVHAFATKEHPTAKAPTLYLKLK